MQETVFSVSDDPAQSQKTEFTLQQRLRYRTVAVPQPDSMVEWVRLKKQPMPDVILMDIESVQSAHIDLVRDIKSLCPELPVLVLTPYGSQEAALKAVEAGAGDYLSKPVALERLTISLRNAIKARRMAQYIRWLERTMAGHMDTGDLVGVSGPFRQALGLAQQASSTKSPVWIEGETGAGRESLARAIHGGSDRAGKAFISVNCEMLPPHLAASILFGQERGSPSSQAHFILGKIREADHGTLLLKEVAALPSETLAKILEFLASGTVRAQGGATSQAVDVRVLFASAQPEKYPARQQDFHRKLSGLFRLASISVPPLRSRTQDIAPLARHFLTIHATAENKYISGITDAAITWLERHAWPGNISQLTHLLWRAVMLCDNAMLDIADLQAAQNSRGAHMLQAQAESANGGNSVLIDEEGRARTLKLVEKEAIRFALEQAEGCMTRAARSLGIGRSTLYRKVSELSLDMRPNGRYISRANHTMRPMMKVSSMERS